VELNLSPADHRRYVATWGDGNGLRLKQPEWKKPNNKCRAYYDGASVYLHPVLRRASHSAHEVAE
jgi:hypothetical protein